MRFYDNITKDNLQFDCQCDYDCDCQICGHCDN